MYEIMNRVTKRFHRWWFTYCPYCDANYLNGETRPINCEACLGQAELAERAYEEIDLWLIYVDKFFGMEYDHEIAVGLNKKFKHLRQVIHDRSIYEELVKQHTRLLTWMGTECAKI